MSVYDKDTFTIPVSFDEFVTWLNGHARRTNVISGLGVSVPGHATVAANARGALVVFILLEDADDRATLRAEIWSSIEPTPEARQWYAETLQAIRLKWRAEAAEPELPPRPGADGATWDDAFDWYHRNRDKCRSLEKLAALIAYEPGTVRNRHAEYQAQRK